MPETMPSAESRQIFFTEIEQFGGAERAALGLARWLYDRRIPVHLVTYVNHCDIARYAGHPLEVVELKAHGTRNRIRALKTWARSRGDAPQPLVSGYQPALHATLAGMRGFHTLMHDTPSLFVNGAMQTWKDKLRIGVSNRIIAHGLRSGGSTIVTSEFLKAECRRDFGVTAHIARMGGMTPADAASVFRARAVSGELRMLSVCRIEANKRLDWILRALAELENAPVPLSSQVNWRLDLAGKGPLIEQLSEQAGSLGIGGRVHFYGFVPDGDLQTLYDGAHLFLMPAVQGYGIPAIESLQRGIPVLLHRESGVSDILLKTPWATVMTGGEEDMTGALRKAIDGAIAGRQNQVPLPTIPTEDEWAEKVARLCGWVA